MKVIYPGSFDPLTEGHMDMIRRLSTMADELIVAVLKNENKNSLFSLKEREDMVREAIEDENLSICIKQN